MAVQEESSAQAMPTRPVWNSSTVAAPTRAVMDWGFDQVVPSKVATCPVLST